MGAQHREETLQGVSDAWDEAEEQQEDPEKSSEVWAEM